MEAQVEILAVGEDEHPPDGAPEEARWALRFVGLVAVGFILYFGRPVLVPVVSAAVLSVVLLPATCFLERLRLPSSVSSGMVVLLVLGVAALATERLSAPALRWLDRAPETLSELRTKLGPMGAVAQISEAADEVEKIAAGDTDAASRPVPVARGESLSSMVLDRIWAGLTSGALVAVLTYFFLSYRHVLMTKLIRILPSGHDQRWAVAAVKSVRREISMHLFTITLINAGLGVAVGLALWAAGMPSPALWGAMAGVLNFVPYLGAVIGIAVVTLVATATFDPVSSVLIASGSYALLTTLEGMVITPSIVGKRLQINPLAVLLGIVVGAFFWGVVGVLLAVPILIATKAVADHHPGGRRVGVLLGR